MKLRANGLLLTVLLLIVSPARPQNPRQVDELIAELYQPDTTVQASASLLAFAEKDRAITERLSRDLPAMLLNASDVRIVWSEASLAGKLKIRTAMPVLIALLDKANLAYGRAHTLSSLSRLDEDPVGRALYDLGPASIQPLGLALQSEHGTVRMRAASVLTLYNNSQAFKLLEDHIDSEPDLDIKRYIKANVQAYLERSKPPR